MLRERITEAVRRTPLRIFAGAALLTGENSWPKVPMTSTFKSRLLQRDGLAVLRGDAEIQRQAQAVSSTQAFDDTPRDA